MKRRRYLPYGPLFFLFLFGGLYMYQKIREKRCMYFKYSVWLLMMLYMYVLINSSRLLDWVSAIED